ncbi:MAG: hypothetical protein K2Y39_16575 [Candidatus Obscuribacterales bacterium]|nr:hypothetical protein [Candidatus Obscuribacterales bacterium]
MTDRTSQKIEQAATRLSESSRNNQLDNALEEVNSILQQGGNLASEQAALVRELEQSGALPRVLISFATGNDLDGNGINDALDSNNDGVLAHEELEAYLNSVSGNSPAEALLAQSLLDRFSMIESADNARYGMAAGVLDGNAGSAAFADYGAAYSSFRTNADGSVIFQNADGLISEVALTNGESRQFVYDQQGNIIQYTDELHHIYKMENGHFVEYESDGTTPTGQVVEANHADLDRDGNLTLTNNDGSRTVFKTDGSEVTINPAGQVTRVEYANGSGVELAYDSTGSVSSVTSLQSGQTLAVGAQTRISVDPLGTVTMIQSGEGGYAQVLRTDGSAATMDLQGNIHAINFTNGTVARFIYDETGAMSQIVLPDGSVLTKGEPGQPWLDASGQPAASDIHLTESGVLVVTYTDGNDDTIDRVVTYNADGTVETSTADIAVSEMLSEESLDAAARDIRGALNFESALGHFGNVDSDRIIDILAGMSEADRRNLEAEYFEIYGISLRDELQWRLNPETYARTIAVLDREDGEANDLGQVEIAFTHLNTDSARGQTELINTLSVLNSADIQALDAEFTAAHGYSLRDAIMNDGRIDQATKDALLVLLNGTDQNLDANGNWRPEVFTQLSDLALQSGNLRLFETVFRSASEESRQEFAANGGGTRIFLAFSGNIENLTLAIELAGTGEIQLSTLIEGNTHFLHTDRESIELALRHASPEDRALYLRGQVLAESGATPTEGPDAEALAFYNNLHGALVYASGGTDWEILKWEDILLRGGSLIEDLASLQVAYTMGIGGTHHTTDEFMSTLEGMSEEDWERLHSDPAYAEEVRTLIRALCEGAEEELALRMLEEKIAAPDYEASQLVGRRGLVEFIEENSWFGIGGRYEPGRILDRIATMTPAEIEAFRANPSLVYIAINGRMASEPEHSLALRMLAQIEGGASEVQLSAADQVLYDQVTDAPPYLVFEHLEDAMADPEFRERMQNPQNDEDRAMRDALYNASVDALRRANIYLGDGRQYGDEGLRGANAFLSRMFTDGGDATLPVDMQMALCTNDAERLECLRNVTADEQALLLNTDSNNQEAVALRERVFGPLNDDLDQLFTQVLQNGFVMTESGQLVLAMNPEDYMRAFVLGAGPDMTSMIFEGLTNDQIVVIKNNYAEAYGSDLTGDVLATVPEGDRFSYGQMLETVTTDARQNFYDLGNEFLSHLNGLAPQLMMAMGWNASQEDALRQFDQFRSELMTASSNFEELSPERQLALANNFADAIEQFRQSKEEFSDVAVDAAVMAAGMILAAVTAGQSLTLNLLLKAAALGAGMKIGGGMMMQGSDYESSEIAGDAFSGAVMMAGNLFGPHVVARLLGVGRGLASPLAQYMDDFFQQPAILTRLAEYGLTWNRGVFNEGLEEVFRNMLLSGNIDERAFYSLIDEAIAAGDMALGTVPQGVADAARNQFVRQFAGGLADLAGDMIGPRTGLQTFLLRLGLNEAAAVPIGAIASGGGRLIAWDGNLTIEQNIQEALTAAGTGAVMGAGMAFAFTAGHTAIGYAWRTARGLSFRNTSDSSIPVTDIEGRVLQIEPGETVILNSTDQLALPENVQIEPVDSPDIVIPADAPDNVSPDVIVSNADDAAAESLALTQSDDILRETLVLSDEPTPPVINRSISPGVRNFIATDPDAFEATIARVRSRTPETRLNIIREVFSDGTVGPEMNALIQHHGPTFPLNPVLAEAADLIIACHPNLFAAQFQPKAVLGADPGRVNIQVLNPRFDATTGTVVDTFRVFRPTERNSAGLSLGENDGLTQTVMPGGEIEFRNADGALVRTQIPRTDNIVQYNYPDGMIELQMPDQSIQYYDSAQNWLGTRYNLPEGMIRVDLPQNLQELHYPDGHYELRNLADNTVRVYNEFEDLLATGTINGDGSLTTTPTNNVEWNRISQSWNRLSLSDRVAALDMIQDAPEAARIQIANSLVDELYATPRPRWPLILQRSADVIAALPIEGRAEGAIQIFRAIDETGFGLRNISDSPQTILELVPEGSRFSVWSEMVNLWSRNGELNAGGPLIQSLELLPQQDRALAIGILNEYGIGPAEVLEMVPPENRSNAWISIAENLGQNGWSDEMVPLFRTVDALPVDAQLAALRYAYEHFPLEAWRIEEVLSAEIYPQALRIALEMPMGPARDEVLRNIMWDEVHLSSLSFSQRDLIERQLVDLLMEDLRLHPSDIDSMRSLWRQLPSQTEYITSSLETQRRTLLENASPADVEAINRAFNRARAWVIDRNIPPSIAEQLGPTTDATQRPMPNWKLVAAHLAWEEVRTLPAAQQEAAFWQRFEEISATGRNQVLLQAGDAGLYIASSFSGTLSSSESLALQSVVEAYSLRLSQAGASPELANEVRLLMNLKVGAFSEALHALYPGDLSQLSASEIRQLAEGWQIEGALKLALTFGNEWRRWLDAGARLNPPRSFQDSTNLLSLASSEELRGLSPLLLRFADEDVSDLLRLTLKWSTLSPEDRAAISEMRSFRSVMNALATSTYPDALDPTFAVEANRWSIPESIYRETEQRFVASRDLPSPFPDTRWTSPDGSLTGYFLDRNDPRGLYLGHYTNCCQHPEGAGRSSAWYGQESPYSGFFVITDRNGNIIAESWAWVSDDGSLVFDNVEAKGLGSRDSSVAAIYQQAANDLSSQYHSITIGTGNSDLDLSTFNAAGQDTVSLPVDYGNQYTDANNQVILANNDSAVADTPVDQIPIGGSVRYRGYTWQVSSQSGSETVLSQNWTRSISATDPEFAQINPNHPLQVGESYNLLNAEGVVEGGWVLTSSNPNNLTFTKPGGFTVTVPSDTLIDLP